VLELLALESAFSDLASVEDHAGRRFRSLLLHAGGDHCQDSRRHVSERISFKPASGRGVLAAGVVKEGELRSLQRRDLADQFFHIDRRARDRFFRLNVSVDRQEITLGLRADSVRDAMTGQKDDDFMAGLDARSQILIDGAEYILLRRPGFSRAVVGEQPNVVFREACRRNQQILD
jgi:hypothetical protein